MNKAGGAGRCRTRGGGGGMRLREGIGVEAKAEVEVEVEVRRLLRWRCQRHRSISLRTQNAVNALHHFTFLFRNTNQVLLSKVQVGGFDFIFARRVTYISANDACHGKLSFRGGLFTRVC
jgi:hypothetical protein